MFELGGWVEVVINSVLLAVTELWEPFVTVTITGGKLGSMPGAEPNTPLERLGGVISDHC